MGDTGGTAIPYGFCQCGCGGRTPLARQSNTVRNWKRGEPINYIPYHASRLVRRPLSKQPIDHRLIPLGNDMYALVSIEDFESVGKLVWGRTTHGYVKSQTVTPSVYLHHFVSPPKLGFVCDHINQNKLDNRRENLRYARPSENNVNARPRRNSTSGYRGVWKSKGRWVAMIGKSGERRHLGAFSTSLDAAIAYNKAARDLYEDFALLNEVKL